MINPWALYDELIDNIPADLSVTHAQRDGKWCRVTSSEGGVGMAFNTPVESRPRTHVDSDIVGLSLRDAAALSRSWNFAEASYGMAALNAWYALPERAITNGFRPCTENNFARLFDPWAAVSEGQRVGVIGHFPFARAALPHAGEILIFERHLHEDDYPDSAVEYLLPSCDIVFITGSSFVNKTAPRLLELSAHCPTTIVVGPSTPASPALLNYGVDSVLSFACNNSAGLEKTLRDPHSTGIHEAGYRIELHRASSESSLSSTPS